MPILPAIQDRLRFGFPKSGDVPLYRAVQEGCYLANHLFEGESFLNNPLGHDMRGHFRRIGIAHQIDRYCNLGDLPWRTELKPMPWGPWHWLEIVGTRAIAHVCRTDDKASFPEQTDSRQDFRIRLQPDLFSYMDRKPMLEVLHEIPVLYAWLTFSIAKDGRISHLCWASPAADCNEYVGHIDVLEEIERSGKIPTVDSTPDPKEKIRLRDRVAETFSKKASS